MAFDGIVTKAIASELSSLVGARVDKVFEPNKNSIILGIYKDGLNYAINSCIDAQYCRINLTTHKFSNPQVAPNFCMLLRKNLIGLKLKDIITVDLERVVILEFEGFDELDDIISKKLVIELMGKHSNIILLDDENIIIDSLRHIKEVDENFRDILPHTKYYFPTSNKLRFLEVKNFEDFKNKILNFENNKNVKYASNKELNNMPNTDILLDNNVLNINNIATTISNTFNGISKNFINAIIKKLEITELNDDSFAKIFNYINNIIENIGTNNLSFETILNDKNIVKDYFLVTNNSKNNYENSYNLSTKINNNLNIKNNKNINSTTQFNLNFFIDDFYYNKEISEQFKNYRNTLLKLILDTLKKYKKRLYNIDAKLQECQDMDKYRLYGELITSNLYKIPNKNIDKIDVENYYENNKIITIPLDKRYLPSVNAKRYFKKYSKLKNALVIVTEQKKDTLKELDYIESVVYELENCTTIDEVVSIYDEISESEIFKEKTSKVNSSKKQKIKKSKLTKNKEVSFNPIKYNVDGYTIFVGRNNKENDYLTLKFANKNDLWFHTKDFHGSHTILKIDNNKPYPSNEILVKAAELAAKHSKARNSSNVPVDYCEVKYVKKPAGSKPGMVIYKNNKTIFVNPAKN